MVSPDRHGVAPKKTMSSKFLTVPVLAFLFTLFIASCDRSSSLNDAYPKAGQMRVVSYEGIAFERDARNLIFNADFSLWHAGAPAPEGFFAPTDRSASRLQRRDPRGGPGRYSVDQRFFSSDKDHGYMDLFHTVVKGIKKDTIYELVIPMLVYDETTVSASMVAFDVSDNPVALYPSIITRPPDAERYSVYRAKIQSIHDGSLLIAVHTNEATKFEARVVWHEWQLFESSAQEGDNIIQPQSFAQ